MIAPYRVLMVEDNNTDMAVIHAMLEDLPLDTTTISHGNAVTNSHHNSCPFDLVLIDLSMHAPNGFDTVRAIRNHAHGNRSNPPPVIVFTATSESFDHKKYADMGIDDILPKPFTEEQLVGKIRQFLPNTGTGERT